MSRRGREKGTGIYTIFNGTIPALRSKGHTLQEIGDKCGVSRERIRQILNEYYPDSTHRPNHLLPRNAFAVLVGHSPVVLINMEHEGALKPICRGSLHLYHKEDVDIVRKLIQERLEAQQANRKPIIELTCEICGIKFYRKPYLIRKNSPGRFCSKKCLGVSTGNNYGFKAHPENIVHKGANRKWDYGEIYALRDKTGWGAVRIGRVLGIPYPSVDSILQRRRRHE